MRQSVRTRLPPLNLGGMHKTSKVVVLNMYAQKGHWEDIHRFTSVYVCVCVLVCVVHSVYSYMYARLGYSIKLNRKLRKVHQYVV
jgi:hypothetical protein